MPYPVLEVGSIQERCISDIAQFLEINSGTGDETRLQLITIFGNREAFDDAIKTITTYITYITRHLPNETYVSGISKMDRPIQNQLWIARTYLFYQLLICTTVLLQNEGLYNSVFTDYPYRKDIPMELPNFKLGIFGSITPTSDIDLGIQYSGKTLQIPGLAYIVSRFESLFQLLTGKSSLDFDIETYADMMTIPNKSSNSAHPDYFYLDTSQFDVTDFAKILPCAGKSIVRNLKLADVTQPIPITPAYVKGILEFNQLTSMVTGNTVLVRALDDDEWIRAAIDDVETYLSLSYDEARQEYYRRVNTAETLKFQQKDGIYTLTDKNVICDLIVAIGDALTYRMESYICSPTIIHVVRILQASKDNREKYKTATPSSYCEGKIRQLDAYCTIGPYGYIISMLEQIGYIERFRKTYCDNGGNPDHYNQEKCAKKEGKYTERLNDGIYKYKQFNLTGGRRRAHRRKRLQRTKRKQYKRGTRRIRKRRAFS
jgi:hypothetical protein